MERGKEKKGTIVLMQIVLSIAVVILVVSFSATVGLNLRVIYSSDISRYGLEQISGLTKERLEENFRVLVDYNNIWGADELAFPDFPMSEHGKQHFAEVRTIFITLQRAGIVSAVMIAVYTVWAIRARLRNNDLGRSTAAPHVRFSFLKYGAAAVIIIPLVLGSAIAVNWDRAFVLFHKLFFRNDYWLFDPRTDPVIMVLPDGFFMHVAIVMIVIAVVCSAACLVLYARLKDKPLQKDKPVQEDKIWQKDKLLQKDKAR